MNNNQFLDILKKSFAVYLQTNSRSNEKLKILHGAISSDIAEKLGSGYSVFSLGYGNGKEHKITGRYVEKTVDIVIAENNVAIAGIAVKYVMSNYSQNSNNYFENMLGETANIRAAKIPYFQIFVIPDSVPYFNKDGKVKKWEKITERNLKKYIKLSDDDIGTFMHTPNKTLVFLPHIEYSDSDRIQTKEQYVQTFLHEDFTMRISNLEFEFGDSVIFNDYEKFITKAAFTIKGL